MMDGTSKTIIYKPIENNQEIKEEIKYVTIDEFDTKIKELTSNTFKDDIKTMKRKIEDLIEDMKEIKKRKD